MIVLFDGVCNLCAGVVRFVIRQDTVGHIRFAALQSEAGQRLLKQHTLQTTDFDTFVYLRQGKAYTRSTAALRLLLDLGGAWRLVYPLGLIPRFFRDALYTLVAKNRYRLFGRQDSCLMPTPALKDRFIR